MPTSTTEAQHVPPDEAAAIRELQERVTLLEASQPSQRDLARLDAMMVGVETALQRAAAMLELKAPVPDGLDDLEAKLVAEADPAHDAAFDRLLNSPVDALGQLLTVGARVAFSSGLGKGLEVGTVAAIGTEDLVVTIDDGTATPWRRSASRVLVLPPGFGSP